MRPSLCAAAVPLLLAAASAFADCGPGCDVGWPAPPPPAYPAPQPFVAPPLPPLSRAGTDPSWTPVQQPPPRPATYGSPLPQFPPVGDPRW